MSHFSNTSPAFIKIDQLSKSFGGMMAVADVSLEINRGEFFSLLGPSGCGKTTLMRMIAGFETPDTGSIHLDGQDIAYLPPNLRPVNMMFQNYALFPHMTVEANIAFGLKQQKLPQTAIRSRVQDMLDLVQLTGFAGRKPDQLSGGQQQRVALARALARNPKVVLLDEPLAAFDKKLRKETQIELKRIQAESGTTFVVVTHDQEEAMALSDRIAVMRQGRVEQVGSPAFIYDNPSNAYVAGFMGDANLFSVKDVTYSAGETILNVEGFSEPVILKGGVSQAHSNASELSLCLRPEHLTPAMKPGADCDHWISCTLIENRHLGAFHASRLRAMNGKELRVIRSSHQANLSLSVGSNVFVGFRKTDARILRAAND
jgi:spermidine/putrescine ABC transporter ATP-binding subunit